MVPHTPAFAPRAAQRNRPTTPPRLAVLETVRFGEFLRDQMLLSEEQWLAALARHWSAASRLRIGDAVVELGFLPADIVERAAAEFHDGLDVVEIGVPRRARATQEPT
ncbi:MAG: hypothetical protein R3B06_28670 [Kofleriaceae bacterium]